jgi:putative MATE family efflux protein
MTHQGSAELLGTEKITKLLFNYSVPAIVATAASSVYNIIDRIFIGHGVGPLAIAGLALTLPLMNLVASFGALVGIGSSTMVSIRLGQRDRQKAIRTLGTAVMMNVVLGLVVAILALIFLDPILYVLGASQLTLPYAKEFMQIILIGNVFTHLYLGMNSIMRSSGYPHKAMITTLLTVVMNLMLAPLFIFVFNWGIRGAALATVISQIIGCIWVLFHFLKPQSSVRFLPGYFNLEKKIVSDIVSIGIANFLMLISGSIVVILINRSLEEYGGDFAIGAFGIINSISNLIMMIVIGFNQGMQPIVGYSFGAKNIARVKQAFKYTLIAGTCVTTLGFLVCQIFPHQLASAFTKNTELIKLAVQGMHIVFILFPIVGFQMVTTSFFQSIGRARVSIILSLSRQILFLAPLTLILPRIFNLTGVWTSMPAADFIAFLLTLLVLRYHLKSLEKPKFVR